MLTIDTSAWGWPQWIWLGLTLLSLSIYAAKDGQPLPTPFYNFKDRVFSMLIGIILLFWGGFFS